MRKSFYLKSLFCILLFWTCFCSLPTLQAQSVLEEAITISLEKAQLFTTDHLGNAYVVGAKNNLSRYQVKGDSVKGNNTISNGAIQSIDASNPLRILLFYPQFSYISILDKMLSLKTEVYLKKLNLFQITAAASSADGNIWVYSAAEAKLIKINDLQQIVSKSNDLRQETQTVPNINSIIEKDAIVYLCDSINGIYTLDNYGRFLNVLPFTGVKSIQVFDDQILFLTDKKLLLYNKRSFKESKIELPEYGNLLDARIERDYLYLLFPDRLDIFYTKNQ